MRALRTEDWRAVAPGPASERGGARPAVRSHRCERGALSLREFDDDPIPGHDPAAHDDDGHDPRAPHHAPVRVAVEHGRHQSWLESVELGAWVAQPGHLHDGLGPESEARPAREREQVEPTNLPSVICYLELARQRLYEVGTWAWERSTHPAAARSVVVATAMRYLPSV